MAVGDVKLVVAGHIAIDTLLKKDATTISLGGPPCYAGLTARVLGCDVTLFTKVGYDFPDECLMWLSRNQLKLAPEARSSSKRTTRFSIRETAMRRELTLKERCEELKVEHLHALSCDGAIVSPVAGEVSLHLLAEIKKAAGTVYVDPQGFLRDFLPGGRCVLKPLDASVLKGADLLKVDAEEAAQLTGLNDLQGALKLLAGKGFRMVLGARGGEPLRLVSQGRLYQIPAPIRKAPVDTTGCGDILAGAFMASYLREGEAVWAACVAAAASSLAVRGVGIGKIPSRAEILEAAEALRGRVEVTGAL